jgi:hypothetical protein
MEETWPHPASLSSVPYGDRLQYNGLQHITVLFQIQQKKPKNKELERKTIEW